MKSDSRVLVYLPLPPHAHWRGEGIAQTIENILLNLPTSTRIVILTSSRAARFLSGVFNHNANIEVLGWFGRKVSSQQSSKKTQSFDEHDLSPPMAKGDFGIAGRIAAKLTTRVLPYFSAVPYFVTKFATDLMLRRGMIAQDCPVVWVPQVAFDIGKLPSRTKISSFWDPFVFEYPEFKNREFVMNFMVSRLATADNIVTQSKSNKDYLTSVLNISPEKVTIINNGSPTYSALSRNFGDVPVGTKSKKIQTILERWPESWRSMPKESARRTFVSEKLNRSVLFRLSGDSRDTTKIIFVSTQYRPYKGFSTLFQLYDEMVRSTSNVDYRFIFTAEVPKNLKEQYAWSTERLYEMPRLSTAQHMCIYKMSDLVLHPSLAEGGVGVYPAFEAASVGVPSLTNRGRHTDELAPFTTNLSELVADFADREDMIRRISTLLFDPNAAKQNVNAVTETRIEWPHTAQRYADFFLSVEQRGR